MPTRRRLTRWEIASVAAIGLIAVVLATGYATSAFEARRRDAERRRELVRSLNQARCQTDQSIARLSAILAKGIVSDGLRDGLTVQQAFAGELEFEEEEQRSGRGRTGRSYSGTPDSFSIDGWLVRHHVRRDAPPTQSQWFLSLSRAPSEVPSALGLPSIALLCAVVISEKGDVALSADSSVLGSGETGIRREIIEFLETGTIHQLIEQDPRWARPEER